MRRPDFSPLLHVRFHTQSARAVSPRAALAAWSLLAALVATALAPNAAGAQDTLGVANDSLVKLWTITIPPEYANAVEPRSLPGLNASTPSAFGASWRDVFFGGGYQANTRPLPGSRALGGQDGSVVAGFGLGSAKTLGLEVALTSFSTINSGFFTRAGVSLKLHHRFTNGIGIGVGRETAFVLGQTGDGGSSDYVAVSRVLFRGEDSRRPFSAIGWTVGLGNGRYRFNRDVQQQKRTVNAFGSLGVRLSDPLGVALDWNGQDLTFGASIVPLRCIPLTLSPAITDLTRNAGSPPRFIFGFGTGFRYGTVRATLQKKCW